MTLERNPRRRLTKDSSEVTRDVENMLANRRESNLPVSQKTQSTYRDWICAYRNFCLDHDLNYETAEAANARLEFLATQRSPSYAKCTHGALNLSYKFDPAAIVKINLSRQQECRDAAAEEQKIPANLWRDIRKICESDDNQRDKRFIFIMTIYYTGLRPTEVLQLTYRQIEEYARHGYTHVVCKRNIKSRRGVEANGRQHFYNILRRFPGMGTDAIFFSNALATYRKNFYSLQKNLGIRQPYYGLHKIRSRGAQDVRKQTGDNEASGRYLGHAARRGKSASTNLYLRRPIEDYIEDVGSSGAFDRDDADVSSHGD
jgi:integrase